MTAEKDHAYLVVDEEGCQTSSAHSARLLALIVSVEGIDSAALGRGVTPAKV